MRSLLPILAAAVLPLCSAAQTILIDEDFEAYSAGDPVAELVGLPWSTWNNMPGGIYDTHLSDAQARSGSISMLLESTSTDGGPADIMLRLGDKTSGTYRVSWWMYIPSGSGGYFNIQNYEIIGAGSWAAEVQFRANGSIVLSSNMAPTTFIYPHDQWYEVDLLFDLDAAQGVFSVDGTTIGNWSMLVNAQGNSGLNRLGGVNFFAFAGGDLAHYYVDDVLYEEFFSVGVDESDVPPLSIYPIPAEEILFVDVSHFPQALITLLDPAGRCVASVPANGESLVSLPVAGLSGGVYFLRIQEGGLDHVRRVVVH